MSIDDTPGAISDRVGGPFDLAMIDCYETASVSRLDCLCAAMPVIRPGGHIVLDDSDRAMLRRAPDLLPGWGIERHIGMKQFPLMAIETTIFTRPD